MTVLIVFGPAARTEMIRASDWYAAHSPAIATRFIAEVDVVVRRIAENPLSFPLIFKDVRRARLHRFPYSLLFRIDEETAHVIACFHASRDPLRWQRRR